MILKFEQAMTSQLFIYHIQNVFELLSKYAKNICLHILQGNVKPVKGQLISKYPYKNQLTPKYQGNYFWISTLKFFEASLGLPKNILGLPVGFLFYDITY